MEKFSQRLKILRNEQGITQTQLAKETGLSQSGIALWESGKRVPNADVIIVLANFFNVSTDYLLGVADE
ncbi:helix-turn-helix domain-containing protein [Pumilibacter intestinalis]|jgi:transcriptional regulator with XRE-family HTH domain|uniref:helix-turn-helix domain-containing protein n=1 Tax=Pumilibacter intestinalis TaxID=2941511 RepID=UPI00203B184F|nr:helix-turn-helix transcriptional regulator [Pumilibacter intestinalis]MCI8487525.1 helix-turn-helix transcriptional regulator [Clostridia bacterium]